MGPYKSKRVTFKEIPNAEKVVKIKDSPAEYKYLPVSWQIGMIDFDTDWGYWSFSDKIKFRITDDLIESLEGIPNNLLDLIFEIDGKQIKNINSLINILKRISNDNFQVQHFKEIINNTKRHFFFENIYPKLKEFEKKNWYEVEDEKSGYKQGSKHHTIKIESLNKKAQNRLEELNLDEITGLFSFRLEGKLRILGIRKFNFLQILWIDPNHEINTPD